VKFLGHFPTRVLQCQRVNLKRTSWKGCISWEKPQIGTYQGYKVRTTEKSLSFTNQSPRKQKASHDKETKKEKERISSKRTQDEVLDELKKAEERSPIANSPFGNEIAISNNPTVSVPVSPHTEEHEYQRDNDDYSNLVEL